jgi:hypothetical protein
MSSFLLVCIFVFSGMSLVSYIYCWLDMLGGKPYILSLRQITTIMDRSQLNQLFGKPGKGFYYTLTPQMIAAIIRTRKWYFFRECLADTLCVYGAWRFMMVESTPGTIWLFILLASACQGVNLLYSVQLVKKWGDQLREEIDNSDD